MTKSEFDSWVLEKAAEQWKGRTQPIARIKVSRADWPFEEAVVMVGAIHVTVSDDLGAGDIMAASH